MPGRASQLSSEGAYNIGASRWNVPFQVLSNKKSLDEAFRKHVWTMQQETTRGRAAGPEQKQDNLNYNILTQAVEIAKNNAIQLETPEGQKEFQKIYQALLYQASGGQRGSMLAAGGEPPPDILSSGGNAPGQDQQSVAERFAGGFKEGLSSVNPMKIFRKPSQAGQGKFLDQETARRILRRAGGDPDKARKTAKEMGYSF